MPLHNLTRFPRLEFIGAPTPLEYLPRFSDYLGREIFIKRDDVTPMAMGGNKLRKLEFLAADALREGADTLLTAGAIQSNHVRQTAAVAAKLGLHCVARLEGILLDPVYTGKAMAGLIDGISQKRFKDEGPILFIHTGGAPALFAYHPHV
ncbi:pyridoxal-phosphate dependent enzyme [Escherichia albertii]|uniref:pyridoxal-phosphate dependent enzyme n=1 Tax=Escherichia albertii TaxID=208962 RepID=UPI0017B260AD|nr:pyridoxal-phosphate dependent enzyme [Escherichia albertii]EGE0300867.1 hypothetical protein [Escherichia albertii]EKD4815014.1 pyridoxal-phosphate dependent enzyme [Escherichia albertii]MCI5278495.1 pyridoxal-phosphate dependent enzyme [Escherichia albertii]MCZ8660697.1 pyridoxal-phosphate dependent enzyme [Escherichia albertii]MCZ8704607.1 pyridoxal-phosphate dependent enzyme [Escherichia albertii]